MIGATEDGCEKCCETEPILAELQDALKDKARMSYPEKLPKKKKIVRREIPIVRIDTANKSLVSALSKNYIHFTQTT